MFLRGTFLATATLLSSLPIVGHAAVCDYRPSALLGDQGAAFAGGAAAGTAAAGTAANVAGVYTLVHATTGATMVGGTWAGASAAGTAGIIGGTGGAIGTVAAVVTAPVTIIATAVVAAGVGAFEGGCYFADTRITDYREVNDIVANIAITASDEVFRYHAGPSEAEGAYVIIRNPDSENIEFDTYRVEDLYIVNGVLKHRDWGFNTTIGNIGLISNVESSDNEVSE